MQPHLQTEETARLRKQIINLTDEFKKELSLEQQENLYHLFEIENERNAEELKEVFIFAFTLAIKLLVV